MPKVSIEDQLTSTLLQQTFLDGEVLDIEEYKKSVVSYVEIEQCVAVLSDFHADCSYIYAGNFGKLFGLPSEDLVIDSAFEDCIFNKINPDDVTERHALELQYLQFLKNLPGEEYRKYSTFSRLRTSDSQNLNYINHRTMYLKKSSNGSIWLALCLYSPSGNLQTSTGIDGRIVNMQTGETIASEKYNSLSETLLSKRELEILKLVAKGNNSDQIAGFLNISVYTVRRHRQNIIQKMQVSNTTEALRTAFVMGLIKV
ncbi:DNA-binding CsgD family transcriptional regulator [Flavobacterium sp. HSC-32F16]|uniref:response regulator transcription factor n=1 Tax=Flavobacterium sp. HSC-32F16 TaxID=2910964 RepID=UPI0020A2FF4C|nr:LuxR C-terminal-related transcriptional regulator [Flavobacterium sp. HSC-32F16]MCP2029500.1 DNA-binding CsgD family transcriptional regulator [Flavobacterium sp. HSC-32F16]